MRIETHHPQLLLPTHSLYFRLTTSSLFQSCKSLMIYEGHRPSDLGIVRTVFPMIVLQQSLFEIICTTNIECFICTFENVGVIHYYFNKNLNVETRRIFLYSGEPGSLSSISKTP